MSTRFLFVPLLAVLASCAATTPAPVFSKVSPADPAAPEGVSPLPEPVLMTGTNETPPQASEAVYFCPMHAEVQLSQPGSCPVCGMPLVKKETGHPHKDHEP